MTVFCIYVYSALPSNIHCPRVNNSPECENSAVNINGVELFPRISRLLRCITALIHRLFCPQDKNLHKLQADVHVHVHGGTTIWSKTSNLRRDALRFIYSDSLSSQALVLGI